MAKINTDQVRPVDSTTPRHSGFAWSTRCREFGDEKFLSIHVWFFYGGTVGYGVLLVRVVQSKQYNLLHLADRMNEYVYAE